MYTAVGWEEGPPPIALTRLTPFFSRRKNTSSSFSYVLRVHVRGRPPFLTDAKTGAQAAERRALVEVFLGGLRV